MNVPLAPRQGSGLHHWLLAKSRDLLLANYPAEQVASMLLTAAANSGRTTQDIETEIANAISGAIEYIDSHPSIRSYYRNRNSVSVHRPDPLAIEFRGNKLDRRKPRLPVNLELQYWVIHREKVRIDEGQGVKSFDYRLLFANINFFIAACYEVGKEYAVRSLEQWRFMTNFPKMGYVVPSYFSEANCTRADLNVGERLFIVVEFDKGPLFSQWILHNYLNRMNPATPLIMLVWSGHKSIHGWYACYGLSEYRVRTFQRKASELGADQTCISPSAWIRMPNGFNYKYKTKQKVLYFDEEQLAIQNDLVRREVL
jgi:hypothetical protein